MPQSKDQSAPSGAYSFRVFVSNCNALYSRGLPRSILVCDSRVASIQKCESLACRERPRVAAHHGARSVTRTQNHRLNPCLNAGRGTQSPKQCGRRITTGRFWPNRDSRPPLLSFCSCAGYTHQKSVKSCPRYHENFRDSSAVFSTTGTRVLNTMPLKSSAYCPNTNLSRPSM